MLRPALAATFAWLVLALAGAHAARADVPVPPVARVTDLTGTLSSEQQAALSHKLQAFEARKGSQIAVLMVPTTDPEDIAQFGIRVGDAWKLGRKGVDDGAILIVALKDRRMRIEVGRGLEGAITDLDSSRIIGEFLRPKFRANDYYGGIDAAVDRLIALTDGEPLPPPPARSAPPRPHVGFQGILAILLILGVVAGPVLRSILGRPLGAVATGGVAAFIAWLLIGVLGIAAFAGIATFLFTLLGGLGGNRYGGFGGGGFGGFGGGGFGGGGLGGGGFGGGGGGGFSGGGGGFSGGGASGSW